MKRWKVILAAAVLALAAAGCSSGEETEEQPEKKVADLVIELDEQDKKQETEPEEEKEEEKEPEQQKRTQTVVIDPGHSAVVAEGTEPLGPGSTENKAADTSGTSGTVSGLAEYELTLSVSQKLRDVLQDRGYTVLMTRESNDVPVSCIERADVANNAEADAFVRIHANGSEDSSVKGAMTICIMKKLSESAGCENDGVWETDSMSGNNWSQVPATIVEMGYMTNPEEDALMATEDYQNKIVRGIADGIDQYFGY